MKKQLLPAALIAVAVGGSATAFAWTAGVIGPRRVSGGTIANALEYNLGGAKTGYRRAHAKGICFAGDFRANGAGAALAGASVLKRGDTPVIGRFSLGGGNPLATDGRTVFHAMALLLRTPDRQEWRMALDDTPIFPVATPEDFVALQYASRPDPKTGKPDPKLMGAFIKQHPETKAFQDYLAKAVLPDSFGNAPYYSINAFRFTDPSGTTRLVRWQFVPETPLHGLDKDTLANLPRDYLVDAFIARTRHTPSRWHLQLIVANPGDVTDRATVAWSGPHRTINAGVLTIDRAQTEEQGVCRDLNFDPTILPPGIAISDDPLLPARSKAYATSFTRRAGEGPGPSAAGHDFAGQGAR